MAVNDGAKNKIILGKESIYSFMRLNNGYVHLFIKYSGRKILPKIRCKKLRIQNILIVADIFYELLLQVKEVKSRQSKKKYYEGKAFCYDRKTQEW